ncbi:enoyl-CoA hydratase-related protein [Lapillicoccus sp.]|uniref:enoyl-CoA hydratase/isomerase family protein n=1 Tax=Lapillicoccus sp. TaxID=1909287 RepID=UPI0025F52D0B|nr:enoyl-CoA hydratase-related protein [Lapillicoccus sp.]
MTSTAAGMPEGGQEGGAPLVRLERHGDGGHVLEIVLDRPAALNAVSTAMAAALVRVTREVAHDDRVRCVVVSSSQDRAFCVGADLKERHTLTDAELVRQRPGNRAAYGGILALPVPAVAAVEGFALGGGFELALACDLVVAGQGAIVGLPEVSVGVIPGGGGTQLLTRRIGWSKAASLIFTARRIGAGEAFALGCVDEVVATGTARARALELAATIAEHSPVGLRQAKRAMRLGSDLYLEAGLEIEDNCWRQAAFSGDRAEGVAAFAEKRRPRWPGR